MKIYRVENETTGYGPYFCPVKPLNKMSRVHVDKDHPEPYEEGLRHGWKHGFIDIESLERWFCGWLRELEENGYVIAIYNVPHYMTEIGNLQVVFSPAFQFHMRFPISHLVEYKNESATSLSHSSY